MAGIDDERRLIESHFLTEWQTLYPAWDYGEGGQVGLDDQDFEAAKDVPSVLLTILSGAGQQTSLGAPGSNNRRRAGVILLNIYSPVGGSSRDIRLIADNAETVFINKHLGSGLRTRIPGIQARQKTSSLRIWTMATNYQKDDFIA